MDTKVIRVDLLHEVDALILSGETMRAIGFIKNGMQCRLYDAVELMEARSRELEEIHESWRQSRLAYRQTLTPGYWRSHALTNLEALPQPPLALEALWDGDSYGWILLVNAILPGASHEHPRFTAVQLVAMQGPSSHMGEVALEIGRVAQDRWKVPLYFPFREPSLSESRWWDAHPS
ncbi:hypothetical protein [Corallococcus aberystwythensis]|uniref:Uncharacterized protein n=1 Tax=Corallococcus aberystwythensis TaxID=2316722 RepID=A0A3A8PJ33_9BACT|nr:hypothetical protein [Corallococcus aberystwythensis]RKH56353.1 hypothetical protein D7W81_34155 [Corallococcus aberystwythensis]